jgi:hypothetical protein
MTQILELREGTLIVRIPAFKAKIDTLQAMSLRAQEPNQKARIKKQLQEAIDKRDTLRSDYVKAFKNQFHFSKVAYFMDYDGHDLNLATYYNLDQERISVADLAEKPIFYLHFERTEESRIDALILYDRYLNLVQSPFPNNFTRGGINFLFLRISEKNFPAWRVNRIDRSLFKFWDECR